MSDFSCKWCNQEILPGKRVGRGYCSRKCQAADLGPEGAKKEESDLAEEQKKEIAENIEQAKGGCMLLLFLGLFALVLFGVVEIFG